MNITRIKNHILTVLSLFVFGQLNLPVQPPDRSKQLLTFIVINTISNENQKGQRTPDSCNTNFHNFQGHFQPLLFLTRAQEYGGGGGGGGGAGETSCRIICNNQSDTKRQHRHCTCIATGKSLSASGGKKMFSAFLVKGWLPCGSCPISITCS